MFGSHPDLQRAPSAPRPVLVCRLLPSNPDASFARQGLSEPAPDHATPDRKGDRHCSGRRPASSLRTPRRLIRPGFLLTNRCAAAGTPSSDDLVSEFFDLDRGSPLLAVWI